MTGRAITTGDETASGLGSIEGSMAYLSDQAWWPKFREGRRTSHGLIDDVLWVGHFCGWLERQHVAVERCTATDVEAYMASTASFRPGPRAACQRTATAVVDFLTASSASD